MNKISRRGFFAIPVTSATTAIAASAAMAQPVVRTNKVRYSTCLQCKCGYVMIEVGKYGIPPEYASQFRPPPNSTYCCNSECDLFHVPFEIPKIEVTEVRPVKYNR